MDQGILPALSPWGPSTSTALPNQGPWQEHVGQSLSPLPPPEDTGGLGQWPSGPVACPWISAWLSSQKHLKRRG